MSAQVADVLPDTTAIHSSVFLSDDFDQLFDDQFNFNLATSRFSLFEARPLFSNASFNHLPGLFCKIEFRLEAVSKLAPRFRLGSLNYTEWMEGKKDLYTRYD
jgi:hypothetical protein